MSRISHINYKGGGGRGECYRKSEWGKRMKPSWVDFKLVSGFILGFSHRVFSSGWFRVPLRWVRVGSLSSGSTAVSLDGGNKGERRERCQGLAVPRRDVIQTEYGVFAPPQRRRRPLFLLTWVWTSKASSLWAPCWSLLNMFNCCPITEC